MMGSRLSTIIVTILPILPNSVNKTNIMPHSMNPGLPFTIRSYSESFSLDKKVSENKPFKYNKNVFYFKKNMASALVIYNNIVK